MPASLFPLPLLFAWFVAGSPPQVRSGDTDTWLGRRVIGKRAGAAFADSPDAKVRDGKRRSRRPGGCAS